MNQSTTIDERVCLDPEDVAKFSADIGCECMVCDLPEGQDHGKVEWKVVLFFPGPYPERGEATMLLCEHCKEDWVNGVWEPPFDNFIVLQVAPI